MTRLVFDMSSYIKTGMFVGVDKEKGIEVEWEGEKVIVPSAEYGYENVTNMMVKTLEDTGLTPRNCLLVFEGMHSKSKRLLIDKGYKAKRDKRPPEFYAEFEALRDYLQTVWLGMGAVCLHQDYVEADDVIAYLAQESEEDLIIASRDNDLGALNTETGQTNAHGATIITYNDGLKGIVKLAGEVFTHPFKYVTLFKALVGDSSDSIAGVVGFGKSAFQKLAERYEYSGLDELEGLLIKGDLGPLEPLADEKGHSLVKKIVDQGSAAITSYRLAKLHPEWINTFQYPIQWKAGKVAPLMADTDERLRKWHGQSRLVTADNYEEAFVFLQEQLPLTDEPAFDIETSTGEESDEWLAQLKNPDGVDTLGSTLTGFSITFGNNMQFTIYVSVDHADTNNVSMSQARKMIQLMAQCRSTVIHNNFFELPVLYGQQDEDESWWKDHWKDNGYHGFLPNSLDTKLEASYVDENKELGLKYRSYHDLGYSQQTFDEVTLLSAPAHLLYKGGKLIDEWVQDDVLMQKRRYKMNELPATHVYAYGCDDTICTSALHSYYKFIMQIEHTWKVYFDVEIDASYQHAKNFCDGMDFSLEKMRELEREDDVTYDKAWAVVRQFLIDNQWVGTVPPTYTSEITPKEIKEAYRIIKGAVDEPDGEEEISEPESEEDSDGPTYHADPDDTELPIPPDPFLSTRIRTPGRMVELLKSLGEDTFAGMLEHCLAGEHEKFTAWVRSQFTGEPLFKISNKQMCHLLYDVMKLPVRVANKPTAKMRAKGIKIGNPKGDALALQYGLQDGTPEQKLVLESLQLMQMVKTRRGLYYSRYPYFVHWLTGKIHPSHNQSATNTRRASSSKPNMQQMPKHPKIEGYSARFREVIVPHHPDAVVVSLDFAAQELRVIADYSKDPNMVACYVGDHKKDMHSMTGVAVLQREDKQHGWTLEEFEATLLDKQNPNYNKVKEHRNKGKKINFTTEYGAMAPKLAATMLVSESTAQMFIDARESQFKVAAAWKQSVVAEAKRFGFVRTKEGAIRHLQAALKSQDPWIKSKAERQAVNFKIQSSCAEMTKKAEGRMWKACLMFIFDAVCYGPVHDECVFSVMKKDLPEFIKLAHWCMVQPYGGMFIPIESSISFGPSFGSQFEIGEQPTPEAVAEGLAAITEAQRISQKLKPA